MNRRSLLGAIAVVPVVALLPQNPGAPRRDEWRQGVTRTLRRDGTYLLDLEGEQEFSAEKLERALKLILEHGCERPTAKVSASMLGPAFSQRPRIQEEWLPIIRCSYNPAVKYDPCLDIEAHHPDTRAIFGGSIVVRDDGMKWTIAWCEETPRRLVEFFSAGGNGCIGQMLG